MATVARMPRPAGRLMPALHPHDWPLRAEALCRPLVPGGPADGLFVAFEVESEDGPVPVPTGGFDGGSADPEPTEAEALANLAGMPPVFEARRVGDRHTLLLCHDRHADAQVLSEAALRDAARRLGSDKLVVAMPRVGALYVSTPHPVAVAGLGSVAHAAYDVVARNGGPALSRAFYLVVDGRPVSVFVPGSLAARRAVGVVTRPATQAPGDDPGAGGEPPAGGGAGFFAWVRRLSGG